MEAPPVIAPEKVAFRAILADPHVRPIIWLVLVVMTGVGVIFPIVPLYALSFGVGYDGAGFLIGTFGFTRLIGDLIGGGIVDRKGEQWTAVTGMIFTAACAVATGLAPTFSVALVAWGLAGVGSAIMTGALFAYIFKAAPEGQAGKTLSVFFGAFNIGVIAGGGLGGLIADRLGLAAPMFAYAAILVLAAVYYIAFVPPPPTSRPSTEAAATPVEGLVIEAPLPSKRIVRDLLRVPGFITTLAVNFTYLWFVGAIFDTMLPLFAADELDMSVAAIGVIFSIAVAAEFVVLFPAGSLSDRYGRKAVLAPSLLALAVMIAVLGLSTTPLIYGVLLTIMCFASGFAGVPAAAMLSDIVPSEQTGRAVGAFRFVGDLGFLFGPLAAGTASEALGFKTAFVLVAIPAALALIMVMRTKETLPHRSVLTE